MNLFYLASLLIIFNVCAYGSSLKPGESETRPVDTAGGHFVGMFEYHLAAAEHEKHKYHTEQSRKKFFLNPAKIYHNIKAKKADSNHEAHLKNVNEIAAAQRTGFAKVTKSKSGNKNHYEAVHSQPDDTSA
ncbi:uncharacterized protein FA14DRAFT_158794 [Meira miltonrushii]|uniref:Uncharacterized protein n=1 Tax=Meira miltonrushii TaxID=1280837 RepID=A0A316V7H1_9BASI|nr:uncharacterized protein FA14DRAFT_158794 [Meira miltonrushii]PWN31425.1 hypothetical protein FA14DRAFT_158794 [Meira miltonrushii]